MHSLLISERKQQHIPFEGDRIEMGRSTSLLDRLAMRVGLWLIIWGTRNPDDDREANRQYLERESRERHYVMMQDLHRPY